MCSASSSVLQRFLVVHHTGDFCRGAHCIILFSTLQMFETKNCFSPVSIISTYHKPSFMECCKACTFSQCFRNPSILGIQGGGGARFLASCMFAIEAVPHCPRISGQVSFLQSPPPLKLSAFGRVSCVRPRTGAAESLQVINVWEAYLEVNPNCGSSIAMGCAPITGLPTCIMKP